MRVVFQQELSEVQSRLVELATGAKNIMEKASGAFLNSDVSLADEALALADSHEEKALLFCQLTLGLGKWRGEAPFTHTNQIDRAILEPLCPMDCGKSYRIPSWLMSGSFALGELTQILIEGGIP